MNFGCRLSIYEVHNQICFYAGLAELADAPLSKSGVERRMSANLISSTRPGKVA